MVLGRSYRQHGASFTSRVRLVYYRLVLCMYACMHAYVHSRIHEDIDFDDSDNRNRSYPQRDVLGQATITTKLCYHTYYHKWQVPEARCAGGIAAKHAWRDAFAGMLLLLDWQVVRELSSRASGHTGACKGSGGSTRCAGRNW